MEAGEVFQQLAQHQLLLTGLISTAIISILFIYFNFFAFTFSHRVLRSYACRYPQDREKNKSLDYYDVTIVGAGASGSTAAYFLAKGGANCLLLEKEELPIQKSSCGLIHKPGIDILKEIGIYSDFLKQGKLVEHEIEEIDFGDQSISAKLWKTAHCDKGQLDHALALAAKRIGVNLQEKKEVVSAVFDEKYGFWTVTVAGGQSYKSRLLLCADGVESKRAKALGLIPDPPNGVCTRSLIGAADIVSKAGRICFVDKSGFLYATKKADGDYQCFMFNFYKTKEEAESLHRSLVEKCKLIRSCGSEPIETTAIRCGVEDTIWLDHVLVIGQAAGMADPLTGLSVHMSILGAKLASDYLLEALDAGNYGERPMSHFKELVMFKFGNDLEWGRLLRGFIYNSKATLMATAVLLKQGQGKFYDRFCGIMHGVYPKRYLLFPSVLFPLFATTLKMKLFGIPKLEES